MRKIISKDKKTKKRRIKQFAVGGILVLIMLVSVVGYAFNRGENSNQSELVYNGFKFIEDSGIWYTNIGDFQFSFKYNPNEVESINSTLKTLNEYNDKPLYFNSENSEAETEIYRNLFYQNQIVQRVQDACMGDEKCSENLPIKNCSDNFIIIKESDNAEIKQDGNCVFISGKKEDLTKISDSFLFKIIGVQ